MAGVKGQPSPKPNAVKSPIPDLAANSVFDVSPEEAAKPLNQKSVFDVSPEEAARPLSEGEQYFPVDESGGDFPGSGLVQGALDALPAAGAIAGGVAIGGTTLGLGTLAGAGAGAVAGQSLKSTLESIIFNKKPQTREQYYGELGESALREVEGQMLGAIAGKGLQKAANSKVGQAIVATAKDMVRAPMNFMKQTIDDAAAKITQPVDRMLMGKASQMDTEAAGDAVKTLFRENIEAKYKPFKVAYGHLEEAANSLPIRESSKSQFLKDLGGQSQNMSGKARTIVSKFAKRAQMAPNGGVFNQEVAELRDTAGRAFKNGETNLYKTLSEVADQANQFFDDEVTRFASNIKNGGATPVEQNFLQKVIQARGGQVSPNAADDALAVADEYLKSQKTIKGDYKVFRQFLRDIGESTKLGNIDKFGPTQFIKKVESISSEKLVEKMFDPKNARALRGLQQELPEVFDTVVRSKVSQIIQKASPDGNISYKALYKELNKLPGSTRSILFNNDEMRTLQAVVNNPKLERLASLEKAGQNAVVKWALDVAQLTELVTGKAAQGAQTILRSPGPGGAMARRATGVPFADTVNTSYSTLANTFLPGSSGR